MGYGLVCGRLTPLQPATLMGTNLLEFSMERDFGGSKGVMALVFWELNAFTPGNPFGDKFT